MKCHEMQFSPTFCYCFSVRSKRGKISSQTPTIYLVSLMQEKKLHIHTKLQVKSWFNIYIFRQQAGRQKFLTRIQYTYNLFVNAESDESFQRGTLSTFQNHLKKIWKLYSPLLELDSDILTSVRIPHTSLYFQNRRSLNSLEENIVQKYQPNIFLIFLGWWGLVGNAAFMGKTFTGLPSEGLNERSLLEDLGVDGRIISKCVLRLRDADCIFWPRKSTTGEML